MSTHNICFQGDIRKIFTLYSLLSEALLGKTAKSETLSGWLGCIYSSAAT